MEPRVLANRCDIVLVVWMFVVLLNPTRVGATVSTPAATPDSDSSPARTLGELIERTNRGWERVETLRTRTVIYQGDGEPEERSSLHEADLRATPSGAVVATTIQEIIRPDRKRVRQLVDDEVLLESIVVDGRVFIRSSAGGEEMPWMEVDFGQIDPDSAQGIGMRVLLMPVEAPFASVPPILHALTVDRIGTDQIAERSCDVYRINPPAFDPLLGADRDVLDLTVAIAADDLVCWTEVVYERYVIRTTLEMVNQPLAIEIPDDVAPMATPAER